MKKYFFVFVITLLCGFSTVGYAQKPSIQSVQQCMRSLPQELKDVSSQFKINGKQVKFPYVKTSFSDMESNLKGLGYRQGYKGPLCLVSVYMYDMGLPFVTEDLSKKMLLMNVKSIDEKNNNNGFKHWDGVSGGSLNDAVLVFDANGYGTHSGFSNNKEVESWTIGAYRGYLIKGRTTCEQNISLKDSIAYAETETRRVMGAVVKSLDECFDK